MYASRSGKTETRQLLPAIESASREALLWFQGGAVAVRDLLPGSKLSEIAWFDASANKVSRRRVELKGTGVEARQAAPSPHRLLDVEAGRLDRVSCGDALVAKH